MDAPAKSGQGSVAKCFQNGRPFPADAAEDSNLMCLQEEGWFAGNGPAQKNGRSRGQKRRQSLRTGAFQGEIPDDDRRTVADKIDDQDMPCFIEEGGQTVLEDRKGNTHAPRSARDVPSGRKREAPRVRPGKPLPERVSQNDVEGVGIPSLQNRNIACTIRCECHCSPPLLRQGRKQRKLQRCNALFPQLQEGNAGRAADGVVS